MLKLTPKGDQSGRGSRIFWPLIETNLGEFFFKQNAAFLRVQPYARPKSEIYTPKRDDEHPYLFLYSSPPPPPPGVLLQSRIVNVKIR